MLAKNESHRGVAFCGTAFNGIIMLMAATQCIDTLLFGQVCDDCHGSAIFQMVGHVVSFLTGGIILLATIGVIIAGIMILTSRDNAQQLAKAKKRLVEVIIGIVVFAGMSLIADFLLPGGVANNSQNSGICPEVANLPPSGTGDPTTDPESSATMTDIIAKTAATMSWPIQSWQEGFDPFFDTSADGSGKVSYGSRSQRSYGGATTIGKCWWQGGSQWITQAKSAGSKHLCANTKTGGAVRGRITYDIFNIVPNGAFASGNAYASCDRFVSTVLYSLKLNVDSAGNKFPQTGPTGMGRWFRNSPDWTEIENKGTSTTLMPGDIFQADQVGETYGHVAIYVGSYGYTDGSKTYNLAEASSGGRYPRLTEFLSGSYYCKGIGQYCACNKNQPYHIYRYTGKGSDVGNPWKYFFKNEGSSWKPRTGSDIGADGTKGSNNSNGSNGNNGNGSAQGQQSANFEAKSNVYMTASELGAGNQGSVKGAIVHVPNNATTNMPLLVFLRGTVCQSNPCEGKNELNIESLKKTMLDMPPIQQMNNSSTYANKIIAISPVINNNAYNGGSLFANIKALIDATVSKYSIDKNHIYIYGYSLGGAHTWCMVNQYPQFFKAASVISMNVQNGCVAGAEPKASNFTHTKVKGFVGEGERNLTSMQNFLNTIGGNLVVKNSLHENMLKNINFDSEVFNWFINENK